MNAKHNDEPMTDDGTDAVVRDDAQNLNDALETLIRQEAANVLLGDETDDATVPFSIDTSGLSVTLTVYHNGVPVKRGVRFANDVIEQARARRVDFSHTVVSTDHGKSKTVYTIVADDNVHPSDKRGE